MVVAIADVDTVEGSCFKGFKSYTLFQVGDDDDEIPKLGDEMSRLGRLILDERAETGYLPPILGDGRIMLLDETGYDHHAIIQRYIDSVAVR